jgi:hypothetical protein
MNHFDVIRNDYTFLSIGFAYRRLIFYPQGRARILRLSGSAAGLVFILAGSSLLSSARFIL